MPLKAGVVKAMLQAGTIIAWAAWLPAGLASLVRAAFICLLTTEAAYPETFSNLNPQTGTRSNGVPPSFLFQTQNGSVTLDTTSMLKKFFMPCDLALCRNPMAEFTKLVQLLEALSGNTVSGDCAGVG